MSQEEIDALLRQASEPAQEDNDSLTDIEKDALGEIGNISMGSAATALSQLLNQRVVITTPKVSITTIDELLTTFTRPYLIVEVNFTMGLEGSNLLVIHATDAMVIADLMMGGTGQANGMEITEIQLSAVAEAMNQMIGSAATSMSSIFRTGVNISPPKVIPVDFNSDKGEWLRNSQIQERVAVVSFRLEIGNLIDSEIMQIMSLPVARKEVSMLMGDHTSPAPATAVAVPPAKVQEPVNVTGVGGGVEAVTNGGHSTRNIDLILDVPLRISVILGRSKKPIREVLGLVPGSIVELEKLANEPVEILVNGKLIAFGEVVVINENFGVRINSIITPVERINNLRA